MGYNAYLKIVTSGETCCRKLSDQAKPNSRLNMKNPVCQWQAGLFDFFINTIKVNLLIRSMTLKVQLSFLSPVHLFLPHMTAFAPV